MKSDKTNWSMETMLINDRIKDFCLEKKIKNITLDDKIVSIVFMEKQFSNYVNSIAFHENCIDLELLSLDGSVKIVNSGVASTLELTHQQKSFLDYIKSTIILEHNNDSRFDSMNDLTQKSAFFDLIEVTQSESSKNSLLKMEMYFFYLSLYKTFIDKSSKTYVNRVDTEINNFSPKSNGSVPPDLIYTISALINVLGEIKLDKGVDSLVYQGACFKIFSFSLKNLCMPLVYMEDILIVEISGLEHGKTLFDELEYSRKLLIGIEIKDERSKGLLEKIDMLFSKFKDANGYNEEGCYIATMVYEDYDHPQVLKLRRFRDDVLLQYYFGVLFVKYYYKYSPSIVRAMKGYQRINNAFKKMLDTITYFIK